MKSRPWARAWLALLCIHLRVLSLQLDPWAHWKDDSGKAGCAEVWVGTQLLEFLELQFTSCIVLWKKQQHLQRLLMPLGGGFCRKAFVVMSWFVKYMPRSNSTVNLLSLNFLLSLSPVSWLPFSCVEFLFSGSVTYLFFSSCPTPPLTQQPNHIK